MEAISSLPGIISRLDGPLFMDLCKTPVLSSNASKEAYTHFFVSTEKQAFLEYIS